MIGRNWLLRAQKSLANVYRAEPGSSSSEGSNHLMGDRHATTRASFAEAEERVNGADYVEARGLLLPATDYLQRAVNTARAQENITGMLLCTVQFSHPFLGQYLLNLYRLQRHI